MSEETRIKGDTWKTLKWRVILSDKTRVLNRLWRDVKEEAMHKDYIIPGKAAASEIVLLKRLIAW